MSNWSRIVMDRETQRLVDSLETATMDALEISGNKWSSTRFKSYQSWNFPEFDICETGDFEPRFDFIVAEQVFEHLLWPYRAGRNVKSLLRPGGYFLITTPFLVRVHNYPQDCTRWTPLGLKHFLAECGFPLDSIQTDSWGNKACVIANLDRWVTYSKWRHSLNNSPEHPYHVWALAKNHD